jgi:hypothetical protein
MEQGLLSLKPTDRMPRPRQRVLLESGLKLDLNKLRRLGLVRPGEKGPGFALIRWSSTYTGEETASGFITSDLSGECEGWLRIQIGDLHQTITLVPRPRHFGGYQWYFVCPVMNRYASVLWLPPRATRFCSRQAWGKQVAYASQFADPDNRAHRGQAKIKARLIGDLDPDEWDLPPKPKGMRWRTYDRYVERYDVYEEILNDGIPELLAKLGIK